MGIARDKMASIDERIASIHSLVSHPGQRDDPVGELNAIISDDKDDLQVRLHATRGLCQLDRHAAYPHVFNLFTHQNPEIRKEAIASAYLLGDSRTLFPLVNVFNSINSEKEEGALERYEIIRAIGRSADPRAAPFLEQLSGSRDADTARLAQDANAKCAPNSNIVYTFCGPQQQLNQAVNAPGTGTVLWNNSDLRKCMQFLTDETKGTLCYALYVVIPEHAGKQFHKSKMVLAPRRSEHVYAAKGLDVLAAGEIGIDPEAMTVAYIDNHSGGYYPDTSSFKWVINALEQADIPLSMNCSKKNYPSGGYFTKEFLSQQPLYANRD